MTSPPKSENEKARPPSNILDEDLLAASCWSFSGNSGQVGIKLSSQIYPTHVTIDHLPHELTTAITQAPRQIVVWGGSDSKENEQRYADSIDRFSMSPLNMTGNGPPITTGGTFLPLAAFEYDIKAESPIQTFPIDAAVLRSCIFFGVLVIEVRNNWGGAMMRLYRVWVHGVEATH